MSIPNKRHATERFAFLCGIENNYSPVLFQPTTLKLPVCGIRDVLAIRGDKIVQYNNIQNRKLSGQLPIVGHECGSPLSQSSRDLESISRPDTVARAKLGCPAGHAAIHVDRHRLRKIYQQSLISACHRWTFQSPGHHHQLYDGDGRSNYFSPASIPANRSWINGRYSGCASR